MTNAHAAHDHQAHTRREAVVHLKRYGWLIFDTIAATEIHHWVPQLLRWVGL